MKGLTVSFDAKKVFTLEHTGSNEIFIKKKKKLTFCFLSSLRVEGLELREPFLRPPLVDLSINFR